MATVAITLSAVSNKARSGLNAIVPIQDAEPYASAFATSSATSQQAAISPFAGEADQFWTITATGGDVWAAFGEDPVAAPGNQWLIASGTTREFAAKSGQVLAIIDAA
jgi:hypothetical protein